ncbi:glycosyltransferase family 4 protein [Streptomonospora litoralis]|uniref:GDP-mannose-dependent alpha-(1-6)-phosphatidylinositol monomannoside mannosyltransferase n=1 Tax=Streptomonospora litoralis TaxID=2498135 RepID=A0A4P6Q5L2_9ACTN|nr:glycosyltransferase family 4 protein [Streptomonospora litoralis]QBI54174.1 GDP-mannose-dependent alpha-(1-6)-phosphatidylinositol monomannoside mannosyltransferase [Streptomonospora litoralis]
MAARTLLVTNDFPGQRGGFETFGSRLARRLAGGDGAGVVVHTASSGNGGYDDYQDYPIERDSGPRLLPTARTARRVAQLMRGYGCDRVLLAEAGLGLVAPRLRPRSDGEVVAATRGARSWGPAARPMLRRIASGADVLAYPDESAREDAETALPPDSAVRLVRLTAGVDTDTFRPGLDGAASRRRLGLGEGPVILSAARLVRGCGADSLVRAMTWLRVRFPGVRLVVAGDGPDLRRLRSLAAWAGVAEDVVFAGPVAEEDLPPLYAAADIFALPCRSGSERGNPAWSPRMLEAAACGLPVVVGGWGPAPDRVRHGETGYVVDGDDARGVARRLSLLLADPRTARAMGERGRDWVLREWTWKRILARLDHTRTGD